MPGLGSDPKLAVVQARSPESFRVTNLSLMPKDTERGVAPTRQTSPSSAHLEYWLGQSLACATLLQSNETATQTIFWFEDSLIREVEGRVLFMESSDVAAQACEGVAHANL
jgi:hypothetical protein